MLLLSDVGSVPETGEEYWRERRAVAEKRCGTNWVSGVWQPWPDVRIHTLLVSLGPWHLRVHRIESARKLKTAEGGFALRRYNEFDEALPLRNITAEKQEALAAFPWGASRIAALEPSCERAGIIVVPAPNLNVLEPSVVIPTLMGTVDKGITVLAAAVRAGGRDAVIEAPLPVITLHENGVEIAGENGKQII
jgi:hypothetical protein